MGEATTSTTNAGQRRPGGHTRISAGHTPGRSLGGATANTTSAREKRPGRRTCTGAARTSGRSLVAATASTIGAGETRRGGRTRNGAGHTSGGDWGPPRPAPPARGRADPAGTRAAALPAWRGGAWGPPPPTPPARGRGDAGPAAPLVWRGGVAGGARPLRPSRGEGVEEFEPCGVNPAGRAGAEGVASRRRWEGEPVKDGAEEEGSRKEEQVHGGGVVGAVVREACDARWEGEGERERGADRGEDGMPVVAPVAVCAPTREGSKPGATVRRCLCGRLSPSMAHGTGDPERRGRGDRGQCGCERRVWERTACPVVALARRCTAYEHLPTGPFMGPPLPAPLPSTATPIPSGPFHAPFPPPHAAPPAAGLQVLRQYVSGAAPAPPAVPLGAPPPLVALPHALTCPGRTPPPPVAPVAPSPPAIWPHALTRGCRTPPPVAPAAPPSPLPLPHSPLRSAAPLTRPCRTPPAPPFLTYPPCRAPSPPHPLRTSPVHAAPDLGISWPPASTVNTMSVPMCHFRSFSISHNAGIPTLRKNLQDFLS